MLLESAHRVESKRDKRLSIPFSSDVQSVITVSSDGFPDAELRCGPQCGGRRNRRRCRKGAAEAPLLEPLAPEAAASDSLAIYTDALYAPPKGLHPPVFGARPYGVQV